jgi:cell division protein ZapA (FtsZ GTPase activity inhibitor)
MRPLTIGVRVVCPDADAEGLHDLAHDLRQAVLAADVDDVRPATAGPPPAGAKSGEAIAIGALVVTLAPTVVEALMAVVSSWLSRQPNDVEVEIDGRRFQGRVTRSQREELVTAYLRSVNREP